MRFQISQVNQRDVIKIAMAILFSLSLAGNLSYAQRGQRPGGRSGFGFRPPQSSLLRALRSEELTEELKLTAEQSKQLVEIGESARPDRQMMFEIFGRMREAQTNEEKEKIQAEISEKLGKRIQEVEKQIQELLSEEQFVRMKQVGLQMSGTRALLSDEVVKQLKITEEQKTKMQEILDASGTDPREFRNLPEEEQNKQRQEIEKKIVALLSEEQNKQWRQLLGAPLGESEQLSGDSDKPAEMVSEKKDEPQKDPQPPRQEMPATADNVTPAVVEKKTAPADTSSAASEHTTVDFGTQDLSEKTVNQEAAASMTFNFKDALWEDVLRLFARTSGLTLDLKVSPPGTFNYFDRREHTPTEALDVLNGYLIQRGFILVKQDRFLIVEDISEGVPPNLVPTVNHNDLGKLGRNDLVRVVFPVGKLDASTMVEDVERLLGPQGTAVALGKSNQLVVTGLVQNIRRIEETLINAKRPAGDEEIVFEAFPLRYLLAAEAEITVRALLGVSATLGAQNGSNSSSRSSSDDRRRQFMEMIMRSRGGGGPPGRPSSKSSQSKSGSASDSENKIHIAVDERSNSLLITARPAELEIVRQALETIDLPPRDNSELSNVSSQKTELRVYEIEGSDLNKVVETVSAMVPGVLINSDTRANVLHVVASPDRHAEVAELIRLLGGKMNANSVAAIPLVQLDAVATAALLVTLFEGEGVNAPAIQSDPYGRSLIVRGTSSQVDEIRSLLLQMGEPASGTASFANRHSGPIREIPLGGRDPQQLIKLLEQMWNAGHSTPLRIVTPGFDNRETPELPPKQPAADKDGAAQIPVIPPLQFNVNYSQPVDKEKKSSDADAPSGTETVEAEKPTSIAIIGDRIVISSENQDSLQELDQLLQTLMTQIQPRVQWRVYYLNLASAEEAATMLQQLIPDLTVSDSSGSSSLSSILGTNSGVITGQPFKLIPDSNLNALFVTGPPDRIRELEDVIRIIDATDLPENFRDQVPHTIPVLHANAVEVAQILKDVFSDYLTKTVKPNESRGGPSPRGNTGSAQTIPGKLSIGVDTRTSQIVVSCNEALFQQISELVKTLDEAAQEANRTIRIVRLDNTDASAIQATLGALLPQVTFSTSSTSGVSRTSSSSSSSNKEQPRSSGSTATPTPPSSDFFREMMRRRMQGSQRGSTFGGGRSSGSPSRRPGESGRR